MLAIRSALLILLIMLVATTAAFGCGDDGEQPEAEGESTEEAATPDERLDPYDTGGQTPEGIVFEYLSAIEDENWDRAHALQTEEGRPDLEVYRAQRSSSEERLQEFSIGERRVLSTATAQVLVSTTLAWGAGEATKSEEWWTVTKEHGYWRIPMDPV